MFVNFPVNPNFRLEFPIFGAMDRKKRFSNKILLVCGASALLLFFSYVIYMKRSPRHYIVPKSFTGWVTIKYEKEGAAPLPEKDGAYEVVIPASGILETSSSLIQGWARDEFFWDSNGQRTLIPRHVDVEGESKRYVHSRKEASTSYTELILSLPEMSDTVLWDGARISKHGDQVDVQSGRALLEHFYVSPEPELFFYVHDSVPDERKIW